MFMDAISTEKICRICLCTNKTLLVLDKQLSDYFIQICDIKRVSTKQLCCLDCKESLKNNLDFRNKCCQSNRILQEWKDDQSQDKCPIDSLHTQITAPSPKYEYEYEIIKRENDEDTEVEIKIEIDESYSENHDITETIDISSPVNTVCKNVKTKRKKRVKSKSRPKNDEQAPRKYRLRGEITKRTEFTEFETVFDIALFATYAEARKELLGRQMLEPYLSAQYRCERCFTVYKNKGQLEFHKKWHDPAMGMSHECDVCSMLFATRTTMLKHKPNCHRGKFTCKLCPLVTYQRQAMKAHFQKHQGKTFKCHCDKVFTHISSYMTHRRVVHTSSHVCVTCARTFVSEQGLRKHKLKMHPVTSAECNLNCEGSVRCEPCGLTFPSEQVYTVHVLNTDKHKDIASDLVGCADCGLTFENAIQLKEHRKQNHARVLNPLYKRKNKAVRRTFPMKKKIIYSVECKQCGQSGSSDAWLYQHYRRAHPGTRYEAPRGQRDHLCDQCGQGFYKKRQLEDHKYVHSGLKPFRCEMCPKTFRTKMSLKNHSERHAPPSRECVHCGKKFNSAANLSNHIRVHTGDRRFVCVHCGKGFLHRAAQREHTRGVHHHIRRERRNNQQITTT